MDRPVEHKSIEIGQASLLIPERIDGIERLDMGEGALRDAAASLEDMWRINRFLGGIRAITQHLYPRLLAHAGVATILDLGTGSAHLAVMIAEWARQHGKDVRVFAADWSGRNLTVAQAVVKQGEAAIRLVQADAAHLPLAQNSIDYLISSLFLHHFKPEQVVDVLREAYLRARRGIIFSDVARGWLPWVGFKLTQPVFARSFLTRYDGAVSIRRAYTAAELRQLADAAGLTNARITSHPLWRVTLTADKA